MKVTVYDEAGEIIGIAWHENTSGYIELPPATRECMAVAFAVNDGPPQPLTHTVRVPVDEVLRLRIRDQNAKAKSYNDEFFERMMREAFGPRDKDVAPVSWWRKIKRWIGG